MAQTAMSETYGKTRGFAYVCRGAGLGVPECWGLGSGSPEPVSRISRYPANLAGVWGQVEILRILGCLGLGWDPENLGVGGQVEILRILKCQPLGS